ncbi:MAG: hypothetical protein P0Y49_13590 [Candidatus Pedobacter colombiensis]|uniref:Uncharacterized protein n=1 Tax=Candidatus Pedobacter colombiensis TaxID=3121371 RepID=A0AAJ5W5W1_9SPHI|nr:hypothetical protein [Pedobacter sp.]WEK17831.1 MAG: hypothetical protein P0Y49_13590 [Pedobacter sp.]
MIEKYRFAVISFYEEKKTAGELSKNLMYPTCANIRNEFQLLFEAGCDNLDNRMLKEFLEIPYEKEISDLAVKKCDTDKFKPLNNFLKKGIKTREKNIELLAWLINFRPRPFSNYWRLSNSKTDQLSELSITESGIVEKNRSELLYTGQHSSPMQKETEICVKARLDLYNQDYSTVKDNDQVAHSSFISNDRLLQKLVTLEYPSGIKLSVDASDLSLIEQLLKL